MDALTFPDLEEDLSFLKVNKEDTQIPVPSPELLRKLHENLPVKQKTNLGRPLKDRDTEYEAFCRWVILPTSLKKPKKVYQFEDRHGLPRRYTEKFKEREDFKQKTTEYFWEWMMSLWPDMVYAIYKRGVKNSSVDARAFAEIISKHMTVEKPRVTVSPMVIMGVPQEKIDALFIPKEYANVKDITPVSNEAVTTK